MKKEYDFSRGKRGKFYRPDARFNLPVYLDEDVPKFVEGIAAKKKRDVSAVVNDLLRTKTGTGTGFSRPSSPCSSFAKTGACPNTVRHCNCVHASKKFFLS